MKSNYSAGFSSHATDVGEDIVPTPLVFAFCTICYQYDHAMDLDNLFSRNQMTKSNNHLARNAP